MSSLQYGLLLFSVAFFAGFYYGIKVAEKYWKKQFEIYTDVVSEEYKKLLKKN